MPWPTQVICRASINSFGFGGTNAHIVIDDTYHYLKSHGIQSNHHTVELPPTLESLQGINTSSPEEMKSEFSSPGDVSPKLLMWSAADESSLRRLTSRYSSHFRSLHISDEGPDYLNNLAFTFNM